MDAPDFDALEVLLASVGLRDENTAMQANKGAQRPRMEVGHLQLVAEWEAKHREPTCCDGASRSCPIHGDGNS